MGCKAAPPDDVGINANIPGAAAQTIATQSLFYRAA